MSLGPNLFALGHGLHLCLAAKENNKLLNTHQRAAAADTRYESIRLALL